MGVSKFISSVLGGIVVDIAGMRKNCVVAVLDMNQHIYTVLEKLKAMDGVETVDKGNSVYFNKTKEQVISAFNHFAGNTIDGIIRELSEIEKLREVYINFDGCPCLGKVQNQIERRKIPTRYYSGSSTDNNNELLFSSALIIQGVGENGILEMFTSVASKRFGRFASERKLFLSISDSTIPGEGEHKALDIVRQSKYTSFTGSIRSREANQTDNGHVLIWGNDSDIIISLLHQEYVNIYAMIEYPLQGKIVMKCVNLAEIRKRLSRDIMERLNMSLLLAFQGNDYLPQMMDTLDLLGSYTRHREICRIHLTKDMKVDGSEVAEVTMNLLRNDEVTQADSLVEKRVATETKPAVNKHTLALPKVIDFEALKWFFREMALNEIKIYHTDKVPIPKRDESQQQRWFGPHYDPGQNDVTLNQAIANPIDFKKAYYKKVHSILKSVYGENRIPTYDMGGTDTGKANKSFINIHPTNPTNEELYTLEMNMALSYMKTYVWYYYYQSGYSVGEPLDNSFYIYQLPPLYSSLYILLDRRVPEFHIQFDYELNSNIKPSKRSPDYFASLPSYGRIQHYTVLQQRELDFIYPDGIGFSDPVVEEYKAKPSIDIIRRIEARGKRNYMVYPFINIPYLIERYGSKEGDKKRNTLDFGQKEATVSSTRTSRFRLLGPAVFPQT